MESKIYVSESFRSPKLFIWNPKVQTMVRQTGKLTPANFYLGWQRTDVERRPTAVRQRSAVVLRIVSGVDKKTFDRGGPVWLPRSSAKDGCLGGGSGGALPPPPKTGGSGLPNRKNLKFRKKLQKLT